MLGAHYGYLTADDINPAWFHMYYTTLLLSALVYDIMHDFYDEHILYIYIYIHTYMHIHIGFSVTPGEKSKNKWEQEEEES